MVEAHCDRQGSTGKAQEHLQYSTVQYSIVRSHHHGRSIDFPGGLESLRSDLASMGVRLLVRIVGSAGAGLGELLPTEE